MKFPKDFNEEARSIIKHLTVHDLSKRYSNWTGGSDDIKGLRFFSDVNFYNIITQQEKPKYVPTPDEDKRKKIR